MNVKEKVIKILANIYNQTKSGLILKLKIDIENDYISKLTNIIMRTTVLIKIKKRYPNLKIAEDDIQYLIDYLESIEIMKKLTQ